jgi:monofunctional biosynthetic peptidoglycan transglycosylase
MSKSTRRRTFSRFLLWSVLIAGIPLGITALIWLNTLPDIRTLARVNPSSTALMDSQRAQAIELSRPYDQHWTWVPLGRISSNLQRAVIVAEDASFFSHEGFDWESIRDAALDNLEAGKMKRGGSTITQQLAKNLYLSSERSLFRKAHEALITRLLERDLPKERILELYLNVAEWGRGIYGAEAAAQHHFGKSAAELTGDEAAWLAAMLPAPRRYDPLRKTASLTRRHQHILRWTHKVSTTAQARAE